MKLRQEIVQMARKKLLSKKQVELLNKFDEERLDLILSTLVTDLFLLTESDLERLLRCKSKKNFRERLMEIRTRLTDADFSVLERGILYQTAKFFGHLEFRKEDPDTVKKELLFLMNRIIVPALEMILFYRREGIISEKDFATLRETLGLFLKGKVENLKFFEL